MLIDFERLHRTYLIGRSENGSWRFTAANATEPRKGIYLSSHQVFSNQALQIALSLYNSTDEAGQCVGVSHCLFLLFTRKQDGRYLLSSDPNRLGFHLDIGVAGELYSLAVGQTSSMSYRAVRAGKAPKSISGSAIYRDGSRVIVLRADSARAGHPISIEIEMDRAASIALAAYCIGYGRFLYPSFSDVAVQSLLSTPTPNFRACAENFTPSPVSGDEPSVPLAQPGTSSWNQNGAAFAKSDIAKLRKAVWAIGNQKWPKMELSALQAIQRLDDASVLQSLIDSGNDGNFKAWDSYLA